MRGRGGTFRPIAAHIAITQVVAHFRRLNGLLPSRGGRSLALLDYVKSLTVAAAPIERARGDTAEP